MPAEGRPSLRQRIGGRWAVSWQAYLFLLILSTVFILTTTPAFGTDTSWWVGLGVSLLAYAATGVVLWIASVTVLRHRRERPVQVWVVFAVGAVAWAARSAVLGVILDSRGWDSSASLSQRLVFGAALGAVAVPSAAWSFDNFDRFRRRRNAALDRLVSEELAAGRSQTYVDAMRLALVDEVSTAVRTASADVERIDLTAGTMPRQAVETLQQASADAVRKVSHETWQEGRELGRVRLGEVLRVAARHRPFQWWGLLFVIPFGIVAVARFTEWSQAVGIGLLVGVYGLVVIHVTNAVCERRRSPSLVAYLIGLGALAAAGPVLSWLSGIFDVSPPNEVSLVVLTSVAFVVVIPLFGLARGVDLAEDEALERLRGLVSSAEIRREALAEQERRLRRELAVQLHGSVGANLTAATMRMRRAIDAEDVTAATEALYEARRLLDVDLGALLLREEAGLEQALASLAESWLGIAVIDVDVDAALRLDAERTSVVVDVVTEGVANSIRHGGAQRVEVRVVPDGSAVRVVVDDNGRGFTGREPGLGSRMLDAHAPGGWTLMALPEGGSRLEVLIQG